MLFNQSSAYGLGERYVEFAFYISTAVNGQIYYYAIVPNEEKARRESDLITLWKSQLELTCINKRRDLVLKSLLRIMLLGSAS